MWRIAHVYSSYTLVSGALQPQTVCLIERELYLCVSFHVYDQHACTKWCTHTVSACCRQSVFDLEPIREDVPEASNVGTAVYPALTAAIADPDQDSVYGMAVVDAEVTRGHWQYSANGV